VRFQPFVSHSLERESQTGRLELRKKIRRAPPSLKSRRQCLTACEPLPTAGGRAVDPKENWISVHRVSVPQKLEIEKKAQGRGERESGVIDVLKGSLGAMSPFIIASSLEPSVALLTVPSRQCKEF